MTKIILLRHCETDDSNEKRFYGIKDVPLNDSGRKHAEMLSVQLKNIKFSGFYSSDLIRAYETARIISEKHSLGQHHENCPEPFLKINRKINRIKELNEINFGEFEGLTFDEIKTKYPEKAAEYLREPLNFRFPGGETLQEFNERVLRGLDSILKDNPSGTVLVVAHSGTNRIILGKALNLPLKEHFRLTQDLGCINVIDFFENFSVVSLMNSKQI